MVLMAHSRFPRQGAARSKLQPLPGGATIFSVTYPPSSTSFFCLPSKKERAGDPEISTKHGLKGYRKTKRKPSQQGWRRQAPQSIILVGFYMAKAHLGNRQASPSSGKNKRIFFSQSPLEIKKKYITLILLTQLVD